MTERDDTPQQEQQSETPSPARDDRRGEVKPTDNPRPSSPDVEADAVREGEEKLERLKPY
jgi:hypothetical protein